MLNVLLLIASLLILTLGAEALVRGSVAVARRLGLSSFFIGLIIVGFGTSTPELFTSVTAALEGRSGVAVGNAIGSNTFNIAVVLGLTALIQPIPIRIQVVRKEVLIGIGVALLPFVALLTGGTLTRWQGSLMLLVLVAYLYKGYQAGKADGQAATEAEAELEREMGTGRPWLSRLPVQLGLIAAGLGMLVLGAHLLVESAVQIARVLGFSELVIGLTVVAAGTSAPELVTSLVAAARKQSDIAVGNVLGSNIFNVLGILGLTCALEPQLLDRQVLMVDAPMMLLVSLAMAPLMWSKHRISRPEGGALLASYVAYVTLLILLARGQLALPAL